MQILFDDHDVLITEDEPSSTLGFLIPAPAYYILDSVIAKTVKPPEIVLQGTLRHPVRQHAFELDLHIPVKSWIVEKINHYDRIIVGSMDDVFETATPKIRDITHSSKQLAYLLEQLKS